MNETITLMITREKLPSKQVQFISQANTIKCDDNGQYSRASFSENS